MPNDKFTTSVIFRRFRFSPRRKTVADRYSQQDQAYSRDEERQQPVAEIMRPIQKLPAKTAS